MRRLPRDRRCVRGCRRLAACGRRLRAVGSGEPALPAPHGRMRTGRLLGDRRPQMAQRAVRLRHRVLRRPVGATRRDELDGRVSRPGRRVGGARADGLHARVLAARPLGARLCGDPFARAQRGGSARRALLRRGGAAGRGRRRDSRVHRPERRRAQPGLRAARRSRRGRPRRPGGGPACQSWMPGSPSIVSGSTSPNGTSATRTTSTMPYLRPV